MNFSIAQKLSPLVVALLMLAATPARAELEGVAAIIAAGAPAVVAGIQARADQTIAGINADAAIAMTQITSQTSIDLARMQSEVSLAQTYAAQNINQMNQDGATQRLQMQLDALRLAREDARQAERERTRSQYLLDQQRIQLAQEQAKANLDLAKTAMSFQMIQAGITGGVTNTLAGGNLLTYSRPGTPLAMASPPSTDANAAATRSDVAEIPAQAPKILQAKSTRAVVKGRKPPASTKASAQLLASVQGPGSNVGGESWSSSPGLSLARRSALATGNQTARGSNPSNLLRIESTRKKAPVVATARSYVNDGSVPHRRQPASTEAPAVPAPSRLVSGGHATGSHDASAY